MLARVEAEDRSAALALPSSAVRSEPIVPAVAELEFDNPSLPRDHPRWVRDALAVSARARELIAKLQPVALRLRCFWDHRVRTIGVGGERVFIDASGSYRLGSL